MKLDMALYKALVAANVKEEHATAVIDALEKEMSSVLATKADVLALRTELKADVSELRIELKAEIKTLHTEMGAMGHKLQLRLFQAVGAMNRRNDVCRI
ncbi:hypothetical protein [Pseudomonas gingeri]